MKTKKEFNTILHKHFMLKRRQIGANFRMMSMFLFLFLLSNFALSQNDVYDIPVVVHIIYTDSVETNISDNQVYSAIDALNDDFRKAFGTQGDGLGVDTEIEFCLAQRDPGGAATNGIVRYHCTGGCAMGYDTLGFDPAINELEVKSLSQWPINDYYNIWIVHKFNGDLANETGFTRMPSGPANLDGSVILYSAFGIGQQFTVLEPDTDSNRTITHEMGHALNLFDTYEGDMDGTLCPDNVFCYFDGDRCCDTNPHIRSNGTCVLNNTTCGVVAPVENYMDNSSESCKSEFTLDQKTRMRLALENQRMELLTSIGCEPPCTEITSNFVSSSAFFNAPITISFTNNSSTTTSIDGYVWYVDRAEVATTTNLDHNFQYNGVYEICLDAYNATCVDRFCKMISIDINPLQCGPGDAKYSFNFNSFSSLPSPPNTPASETVDPFTNWTDAFSFNSPWHCFDPNNSYAGILSNGNVDEFIETENPVNFVVGKTYKISFDYSVQSFLGDVLNPKIEMRLVGYPIGGSPTQNILIHSENGYDHYPSSAGFLPNSEYFCYPNLYNDPGIDYNMEWSTVTFEYTHVNTFINPNTHLRMVANNISSAGHSAVYIDNINICECDDLIPEWNIEYLIEGCSGNFSVTDANGLPLTGVEYEWAFYPEGSAEYGNNVTHEFNYNFTHSACVTVTNGCVSEFKCEVFTINEEPECDNCIPTPINIFSQKGCGDDNNFNFDFEIPVPEGYNLCSSFFAAGLSSEDTPFFGINYSNVDESTNILHLSGFYQLNDPSNPDDAISANLTLCNEDGKTVCLKLENSIVRNGCDECDNLDNPIVICNERLATNEEPVYDVSVEVPDLPAGYTLCDGSADEGQSIYGSNAGFEYVGQTGNTFNFLMTTQDDSPYTPVLELVFCKEENGKIMQYCYHGFIPIYRDCVKTDKRRNADIVTNANDQISLELLGNPVSNMLKIAFKNKIDQSLNLQILDATGRTIYRASVDQYSNESTVDVSAFAKGFYYISILDKGVVLDTKKFVKI